MLKILFIGDICGKPGRETVAKVLPETRRSKKIDFVIANAENAAHGRGVTRKILEELQSYGIDFFTSGDHVWRQKGFIEELDDRSLPIIRPANYPDDVYGRGYDVVDLGKKGTIAIVNLLGLTFRVERVIDPMRAYDKVEEDLQVLEKPPSAIVVDIHADATSDKIALGWYLDDKVSAVLGTHTHVPTADARILPAGTAYVTDVGMVGPRDAILWVQRDIIIKNTKFPYGETFEIEEEGPRIFNSIYLEIEKQKAVKIERIDKVIE